MTLCHHQETHGLKKNSNVNDDIRASLSSVVKKKDQAEDLSTGTGHASLKKPQS